MIDAQHSLDVLLELTRALTAERSLRKALTLVSEAALELLPGDHASIRVLDHTRTELLSGARSGAGVGNKPVRHTPGKGIAGWVVDRGEIARVKDTAQDERFEPRPNQGFDIQSILAVPLWSAGEVVGVLAASSSEPDAFAEEHESLACLLANCAVPPIEKARLRRLAVTDPQTMTFNQAYLLPGLQAVMQRQRGEPSQGLSLALLDLDHFKRINDQHGHAAGDRALRAFADTVRSTTRDADLVVRRGGDEFVLIMPGTDRASACAVADRICSTLREGAIELPSGAAIRLTVSIGVATWNGDETPEQLEKRADEAMYEAKLHGRNQVRFHEPTAPSSEPGR